MRSPAESEVLVIGGGIAGASVAFHLASQGHAVVLLERGEIASEASGVNAGSIDSIGWGDAPDLQATLTAGSLEIFQALQVDLGHDVEFRQSGALRAIQTEAQHAFAAEHVRRLQSRGFRIELLTTREARSLEPTLSPDLLGAIHSPARAQADPVKATRALARAASEHGARVLVHHEVTALSRRGDVYVATTTAAGDVTAPTLVLAAGAWCGPVGAMLGLRIPVVPVRGQMWATDALPPRVFHVISSVESSLHWSRRRDGDPGDPPELTHRGSGRVTRHLYGRQTRDGAIIFGGDRQVVGHDRTPDPEGIAVNHAHATEVLPLLRDIPIARTWAGLMPFSLDGKPLIGRIAYHPNLYIASGLASSGFGRGPMAGKLLAEYIHTGKRPDVLADADPSRCVALADSN